MEKAEMKPKVEGADAEFPEDLNGGGDHPAVDDVEAMMAELGEWNLAALEPEFLAQKFHELSEDLAPDFGCRERDLPGVQWEDTADERRSLMIEVATLIIGKLHAGN